MTDCNHSFKPYFPLSNGPVHGNFGSSVIKFDILATYCEKCGEIRREKLTPKPSRSKE